MLNLTVALLGVMSAAPAMAQTSPELASARQAGIIGERFDGYIGVVSPVSDAVRRQVAAVNIRRKTLYIDLAQRRNVTATVVAIAAACEILRNLGPGQAYLLKDGVWRRRGPGEPAPRPDYCG